MKTYIQKALFSLQDLKYKAFHASLMPTIDPLSIIGVRTPLVRNLAKELYESEIAKSFLTQLPHLYYEENNLHGFLIEREKDYATAIKMVNEFLPFVDNWATCDSMSPKIFKRHREELLLEIKKWISSDKVYTIRFGIEMLMSFFLDDEFKEEYLKLVASIISEEYYVNMMIAWFFATALAKQYESTIPYIEKGRLSKWCHNKAIQKALESYRVPAETKVYLRTLKISNT